MEKSKLRSSGEQENVFVFFGRAWRQVCLKKGKGTDSHLSDGDPFEKKLNAHGVKRCLLKTGDGLALERW